MPAKRLHSHQRVGQSGERSWKAAPACGSPPVSRAGGNHGQRAGGVTAAHSETMAKSTVQFLRQVQNRFSNRSFILYGIPMAAELLFLWLRVLQFLHVRPLPQHYKAA